MKRLNLDAEPAEIREFVGRLSQAAEGVELEIDGRVVCKVIPPTQFTDREKDALLDERWKLIGRAQQRNKGVPAKEIEADVRSAVEEVRRRKQQETAARPV